MAKKWYDSMVIRIEDESSTTKRFWVQVEGEPNADSLQKLKNGVDLKDGKTEWFLCPFERIQ